MTLPWWLSGKESACQWRFDPWVGKILWRRKCQPTPAFLPGKSHRQRSLVGYHPLGCKFRHDLAAKLQQLEGGFPPPPPYLLRAFGDQAPSKCSQRNISGKKQSFLMVETDSKQIYDTITPEAGLWVLCVMCFSLSHFRLWAFATVLFWPLILSWKTSPCSLWHYFFLVSCSCF